MNTKGAASIDPAAAAELGAERERVLSRFGQAWGAANVDALMSLMTEDCIYSASVGPEPGRTFIGKAAVREGFRSMLAYDAGGESREGRCVVAGDVGIVEWSYVHTHKGGCQLQVRGCDIIEFRSALIFRKDAFRKCMVLHAEDGRTSLTPLLVVR